MNDEQTYSSQYRDCSRIIYDGKFKTGRDGTGNEYPETEVVTGKDKNEIGLGTKVKRKLLLALNCSWNRGIVSQV